MMRNIGAELNPRRLLPTVTSGFIVGLLEVVMSLSFAALIFSGDLSGFLANGVGLVLFSGIIFGVMIALFSWFPGTVGGNQGVPAAILAVVAAAIATTMPDGSTADEIFITAIAAIALTTITTGLFFLGLGQFKLAGLIRFLPYPVVGGFLAGTGWLLVTGSIGLMTGSKITLTGVPQLFTPEVLAHWLPGLGFALLILFLTNRFDHFLILPGAVIGGIVLFFITTTLLGLSTAELSDQGWFLGPFPSESLWTPLSLADINQVNWGVIGGQAINVATILIVSTFALLLNVSAFELIVGHDMDIDRELKVAGITNIVAGLGTGVIGYHQLGLSALNNKLGSASRLVGLIASAICLIVLLWGAPLLSFFPKIIVGGQLLYLGLVFLVEWIYRAWFKFSKTDYAIILMILLVIITVGFLEGVALGIVAALLRFVVSYSLMDSVGHQFTGKNYRSRVTRSLAHRYLLDEVGHRLYIAQLQGFIFFGTADKLLKRIRDHVESSESEFTRYVVLDFARVTGLDSTALLSFHKLKQVMTIHDITIVFTEVSTTVRQQLISDGLDSGDGSVRFFPDLDRGVEWCEDQLLQQSGVTETDAPASLSQQLAFLLPDGMNLAELLQYLEPISVAAGEHIMLQGDEPEFLFFVETGQVTAQLERPDRPPIRLETMRDGVIGEIGFYLDQERAASIIADEPSLLYRLSRQTLKRIEQENSETAAVLHRIIVHLLAERITRMVTTMNAL